MSPFSTLEMSAQVTVLKQMIHHATENNLGSDERFLSWILSLMESHLDSALTMEFKRDIFIELILDFFHGLPHSLTLATLRAICHCFSNTHFCQELKHRSNAYAARIADLAEAVLAASCIHGDPFIYEVISQTTDLAAALKPPQKELLAIVASGTIAEFRDFATKNPELTQSPHLLENVQMLEFMTMENGRHKMTFDEP